MSFTCGIAAFGDEADLPCQDVDDPVGLSTRCGFAKPEDLQFIPSRSVVIVSEQGDAKRWSVAEIDPRKGTVQSLFDEEKALHSVTSATDIGEGIVFGSTSDQRIAIARWPQR